MRQLRMESTKKQTAAYCRHDSASSQLRMIDSRYPHRVTNRRLRKVGVNATSWAALVILSMAKAPMPVDLDPADCLSNVCVAYHSQMMWAGQAKIAARRRGRRASLIRTRNGPLATNHPMTCLDAVSIMIDATVAASALSRRGGNLSAGSTSRGTKSHRPQP